MRIKLTAFNLLEYILQWSIIPFWGAVAGAVISAYSSKASKKAAGDAGDLAEMRAYEARKSLGEALKKQEDIHTRGVKRYQPYTAVSGMEMLPRLFSMTGTTPSIGLQQELERQGIPLEDDFDITQTPGYQFRFEEGQRALERRASAGGKRFAGQTLMDLVNYGQDYASTEFEKEYARASNMQNLLFNIGSYGRNNITSLDDALAQRYGVHGQQMASSYMQSGQIAANAELAKNKAATAGMSGIAQAAGSFLGNYFGGG